MNFTVIVALLGFAFVTTVTPGPNNLMLMASGANFGFRRTLPHMLGIVAGVSIMTLLLGVGLMALFDILPMMYGALKVVSIAYLLWLAYKIATSASVEQRASKGRPMTFLQAAGFQWVNPKAWAMGLSAITLYAPECSLVSVFVVAIAFALVCFPAISVWAWLGTVIRQWLSNSARLRAFNIVMALLLVASLYPILGLGK
ncbi:MULTISPECIES: LysE family translocator [Rhizobium]|uniref:LysE family translocator n=1 Tax=Rhizobium rhododendri TaxID=2506430 RepID=A0ABY8IEH7_9HYPH|nr:MULTISPECIES: LysE family translocator [Rhizobium]MBZ5759166.1 LysE family translocator [Rhizobium sp. VS19-DR96]MBZ5764003.1 LysE family translocator [Rhizobium sp. VS19-DR129.2]MBZ5771547.1 LysE family translocator [Rhizobium sp. VS19-DRK62.2]MBZ5783766.1 LysE family translocator [Rhizobium sp. VS19-DR121]MBZ5801560.1 LysE family translocator [Rhizobium sp. VS19-DR181]